MNRSLSSCLPTVAVLCAGCLLPTQDIAACNSLPAPDFRLRNFSPCAPSGFRFLDVYSPVPVNHFRDCTTVDGNGELIHTLVESGSAAFEDGPFVDLDAEIVSRGVGLAGGIVESTIAVRVRRVNDLVAWVNVPVRYTYNVEARVGAIGNNIRAGRMQARVSGSSIPGVSAEACTERPSFGAGCDPNNDQSASRSGSGLLLLGEGAVATGFATAFGQVTSTHPTDPTQLGPNIQGTAVAEIRFQIDPNFAFASAFELEFSDGACIFGGDAGSFE